MNHLTQALARFDAYFRSANGVPPNDRISVPTAEWVALRALLTEALSAQAAPQAVQAAVPKWIDDPHDIEQGQVLNPEWVKLQQSDAPAHPAEGLPAAKSGRQVIVDSGALQMVLNALERDALEGKQVRAEMRLELMQSITYPTQQGLEPTMFWDAYDPERCESSINNVVVEVDNCRGLRVGDIVTIQRAVRLPNLEVRITQCPDAEGNGALEWDEVVAAQAKQGEQP